MFDSLIFSSANLFRALSNRWCTPDTVAAQERAKYLLGYLHKLGAKSIVVEPDYTDGDYLEDFASYYVRCFEQYERRCKRLHFFACEVSSRDVKRFILQEVGKKKRAEFAAGYLGFIVARPLPSAIIGRTVLATYPSDGGRRNYPAVHHCRANLFGKELDVWSVPYQEQDSVLAACATVALWSALHQTSTMFRTAAPRPAAITRTASAVAHSGRAVPSRGLKIEAMCHAVSDCGLEPEVVECEQSEIPLVSLVYGHLSAGLPVILVVRIGAALHAITLLGYSIRQARVQTEEKADGVACAPMIGLRIDGLYGHDDQIGPFARLTIEPASASTPLMLTGSWKEDDGTPAKLQPVAVLVPVYNKIRVTFLDVQEWINHLTDVLRKIIPNAEDFEWDVRLTTTSEFKEEIAAVSLARTERQRLLLTPQPRFLWRAILRVFGGEVLEILFDATGFRLSFPVLEIVWRNDSFRAAVGVLVSPPAMQASLTRALTADFLAKLKSSL